MFIPEDFSKQMVVRFIANLPLNIPDSRFPQFHHLLVSNGQISDILLLLWNPLQGTPATDQCDAQGQTTSYSGGSFNGPCFDLSDEAVRKLQPANDFRLVLSSRTDKGVHAVKNACHVELVYPYEGVQYHPNVITSVLNFYLKRNEEDIRVIETRRVPDRFHSRFHAKGRKYVYRLGHTLKPVEDWDENSTEMTGEGFLPQLRRFIPRQHKKQKIPLGESVSLFDASKCLVLRERLDIGKLIKAAEMISGIHNFTSFTATQKVTGDYLPHPVKLLTIGVKRGQPFGHQFQKRSHDLLRNVEFWDIHVQSSSFLYRQVRRMVGAMVLVARYAITLEDLQVILDNPQKAFPFSSRMGLSEAGLYLLDVKYDEKDLEFDATQSWESFTLDDGMDNLESQESGDDSDREHESHTVKSHMKVSSFNSVSNQSGQTEDSRENR